MTGILKGFLLALVVPPLSLVFLIILGAGVRRVRPALGQGLVWFGAIILVLLSMPVVSQSLLVGLEAHLPLVPPPDAPPQAIVVLGAEVHLTTGFGDAGDDTPRQDGMAPPPPGSTTVGSRDLVQIGRLSLERVRAAAELQRRTHLPILVTGGAGTADEPPVSEVMADSLRHDFLVPVRWTETRSRDTWENARYSSEILRANGITSVYVVTHAWHMKRALRSFALTGLTLTAAPTALERPVTGNIGDFVPRTSAWLVAYYALHEWIGLGWYALR